MISWSQYRKAVEKVTLEQLPEWAKKSLSKAGINQADIRDIEKAVEDHFWVTLKPNRSQAAFSVKKFDGHLDSFFTVSDNMNLFLVK